MLLARGIPRCLVFKCVGGYFDTVKMIWYLFITTPLQIALGMFSNSSYIITHAEVNQPCPKSDEQLLCNVHILLSTCLTESSMSDGCYQIIKKYSSCEEGPMPLPVWLRFKVIGEVAPVNEVFPTDADT